jgi:hypothetical protein
MMFFFIAGVAAFATVAVFSGGIEPRSLKPKQAAAKPGGAPGEESTMKPFFWQAAYKGVAVILVNTKTVFRIRSFQIILVAGIVGSVAMMGMGYKVMYFQVSVYLFMQCEIYISSKFLQVLKGHGSTRPLIRVPCLSAYQLLEMSGMVFVTPLHRARCCPAWLPHWRLRSFAAFE